MAARIAPVLYNCAINPSLEIKGQDVGAMRSGHSSTLWRSTALLRYGVVVP